jgi:aspartyl-tRNA(Asn)/glutamyl-tRNA(Gln) amidotransferase subunit B
MNKYTPIIGLETHVELKTNSKMFCGCVNDPFNAEKPNIYTCPVCLGLPGALPVPNKKAIEWTIKLGLSLNCEINHFSKFDRKNYFYPDLAKGYQISQYDIPFCFNGQIQTQQGNIKIRRIHLEEDTGKLLHETVNNEPVSLIDFNRSGVPLVEIVTEPDIKNGDQAQEYGKKIRTLMKYLNIADCKMAQGGMRLEANISLAPKGSTKLPNYKVEIKNINSFRFLKQAIDYEIIRQSKILDQGKIPAQETRGWDTAKQQTFSQRTKEEAEDYRYFPEPDIPPIVFTQKEVATINDSLPELPDEIISRWQKEYGINTKYSKQLVVDGETVSWTEKILSLSKKEDIKPTAIIGDIINKKINVTPKMDPKKVINIFKELHQTVTINVNELNPVVDQVIENNQDAVKKFYNGKTQVIGFLIGQVMSRLGKKADSNQVRQALLTALKKTQ